MGDQLGQFHDVCIKYTPAKCVAFNFDFHKINAIEHFLKKIIKF